MHSKIVPMDLASDAGLRALPVAVAPMPVVPKCIAAAAFTVGALGLTCGSGPPLDPALRFELPALFGLLLSLTIVEEFRQAMKQSPSMPRCGIDAVARRLARTVYLVLYCLMGLKLMIGWVNYRSSGTAFDLQSVEAFQVYLGYGVGVRVLIQVLAARRRHQAARSDYPRAMSA